MKLTTKGVSDDVSPPVSEPVSESLRPGWIQCRIGLKNPKEGNGASMSRQITTYVVEGDAEAKDSSGVD